MTVGTLGWRLDMGDGVALDERWCGPRESESEAQICLHLAVGMKTSHLTLSGSNIELDIWHFGFLLGEVKNITSEMAI